MITTDIKRKILEEWLRELSELTAYTQNKLYKVLGAAVMGIEILKMPRSDDYRPYFVMYPLWKDSEKACLDEPAILQEILNKRKFQFNIPYTKHEAFFGEAVTCVREQVPIPLEGDVRFTDLMYLIDHQFSQTLVKSSPVSQAKLYEFKLMSALYLNDELYIRSLFAELERIVVNWHPSLFDWKYGDKINWLQNLHDRVADREAFLKQIQVNKMGRKMQLLKNSDIIQ